MSPRGYLGLQNAFDTANRKGSHSGTMSQGSVGKTQRRSPWGGFFVVLTNLGDFHFHFHLCCFGWKPHDDFIWLDPNSIGIKHIRRSYQEGKPLMLNTKPFIAPQPSGISMVVDYEASINPSPPVLHRTGSLSVAWKATCNWRLRPLQKPLSLLLCRGQNYLAADVICNSTDYRLSLILDLTQGSTSLVRISQDAMQRKYHLKR